MADTNNPAINACDVQICTPPRFITSVDIADRSAALRPSERSMRGALVSIDLTYPSNSSYGYDKLVAQFKLVVKQQAKPVKIKDAKVGYFRHDNNIEKLVNYPPTPALDITGTFQNGIAEVKLYKPDDYSTDIASNVRIVLLLDAYPSIMEVSVSLSTLTSDDGTQRLSRAFTTPTRTDKAPYLDEERLQKLLCWTAGLGHDTLLAAYLDQGSFGFDVEDEFGMTPFSWAALTGQTRVFQMALQQGSGIRARIKTAQGPSPLEAAACSEKADVFDVFLRCLRHSGTERLGLEDIPGLEDKDIREEIDSAVRDEQTATIRKLVRMLLDRQGEKINKESWLAKELVKASEYGHLCLVQALIFCGAKIDGRNEAKTTPLMSAIKANRTNVAEFLVIQGAGDREALQAAVELGQHNTIRALLQVGTWVDKTFKDELIALANQQRDSTTLRLLKLERVTGGLATATDLRPNVDNFFEATVVEFFKNRDPNFEEHPVDELMQQPDSFFKLNGDTTFKWYHLPANNMKWAERLISKIYYYDPSLAYKVMEPKRWVKRQHEGESGSPHARFMMPACHDFSEAFKENNKIGNDKQDKHVVLFMPYLHWDEEFTMRQRSKFLADNSSSEPPQSKPELKSKREEMLLREYLLSEDKCDPDFRHVLHIRRTLDQSLYHNLKDTSIRDADQTVHRYQDKLNKEKPTNEQLPLVAIMVDQLWLWVLVGSSGKAQAIVTCFPSRDWFDVDTKSSEKMVLDQGRTTDILQSAKSYIQQRPSAVQTPYDLAGVIASRCSRALLEHSTDMLNFAEVYENSISDITRTKIMNGLIEMNEQQDPDKGLANKIMDLIQSLQQTTTIPENSTEICKKYRQYTLDTEIPNEDEIKELEKQPKDKKMDYLIKLLEKFGRFYVLDITREITLLRQIKDIQDELEMMEKIFAEQKEVLEAMDRIIRMMLQPDLETNEDAQIGKLDMKSNTRRISNSCRTEASYSGRSDYLAKENKQSKIMASPPMIDSEDDDDTSGEEWPRFTNKSFGKESQIQNNPMKQTKSMIWEFRHQKQNLPLRTVLRFSEQVKKMNRRAKNTNSALSTLVDLKQKQNNMIDTRTARLQTEQSHQMTIEAEKQGKTLMVFTIVTIIFLPLSFIAAFFAIPTKEFDNALTLGFVSEILFPLSAAISILFIGMGFLASYWRSGRVKDGSRVHV